MPAIRWVSLFFSSKRRQTRSLCDWSSDVCSSDLVDVDADADRRAGQGGAEALADPHRRPDRKSGVEGKRGDLGGRRIIKKKKKKSEGDAQRKDRTAGRRLNGWMRHHGE